MGDVVDIDTKRPHLDIVCGNTVHVLPCVIVEDIIAGRNSPAVLLAIDGGREIMRRIVEEWYEGLNRE